jgi:hypothetical protein
VSNHCAVAGYQITCPRGCPTAVAGSQTASLSKGRASMQQQQQQQQSKIPAELLWVKIHYL